MLAPYNFLLGCGLIFTGSFLLFKKKKNDLLCDKSKSWPFIDGIIKESKILPYSSQDGSNKFFISFAYRINGETYTGNKPCVYWLFGTLEEAEDIVSQFPKNSTAKVYYNPSNPEQSVLIVGRKRFKSYHFEILHTLLILFGMIICFISFSPLLKWISSIE